MEITSIVLLIPILCFTELIVSWPDGAPCKVTSLDSMDPRQAIEHEGGLQLTPPPYEILLDQKCYWKNQALTVRLRGKTKKIHFKGFVIQPLVYDGPNKGRRFGKIVRLDDNGSWRQQCFRSQQSITNSHDDNKNEIKVWWKSGYNDDETVQFVATVVKKAKEYWVKSVLSIPIPPCKIKQKIDDYKPPPVTEPPPVQPFLIDF
ncbi:hypothetical protein AB6A40_000333 [Gnathostoma spinigerum]|uniref:Reelin domain-containing protein n=1 Tax=Gnathostoma spinigerum TaxID=75299 RepID=A0ABD6E8E4_9BILA